MKTENEGVNEQNRFSYNILIINELQMFNIFIDKFQK